MRSHLVMHHHRGLRRAGGSERQRDGQRERGERSVFAKVMKVSSRSPDQQYRRPKAEIELCKSRMNSD